MFENQKKVRTAERKLQDLRHTDSIFTYNMLFQQYFFVTEWDESALIATYYEELHHEIKNVLIIKDRSKDLEELQKSAIEIAENMYELRIRKRAYIYREKKRNYQNRNVDFMKIDILKRAKNISCFKCEKKSHKKRDCKDIQTLETLNELSNAIETFSEDLKLESLTDKHVKLSWTACYDDDCRIHISEKESSKWYSKKSRKKRTKYLIKVSNDYQSESIENNNNWQHNQIIRISREQTFFQTKYSTTVIRILIKERMLSAIMKRYSTESKITTTALKKLKLKNKNQKLRIWL